MATAPKTIEVTASVEGLTMGSFSVDAKDEDLALASASVGLADTTVF